LSSFPLAGLRVVTFEQAVAMPLCSRHLADLGADVVKVERREGDFARNYDSALHGTSTWFAWLNRGKRSLTLDMKLASGREVAERLIAGADVVLQNFAPGAFDRLGLGVGQLHERYPRLIAASLTGYGEDGPYRDRKAYDLLLQAEAGVLAITGTGDLPAKAAVSVVDLSAGMYAFGAVTAALYRRERTGEGAAIRISLFDSITEWMSPFTLMAEHGPKPKRAGARHNAIVPYGTYRVAGGRQVVFAVQNEAEWRRLCSDVLRRPELADDPRFAVNEARLRNREALETLIEAALAEVEAETVEARLEAAALAYSRMNDVTEVLHHPQVMARDRLLQALLPGGASAELLRSPFNIEGVEDANLTVPAVGEHTDAVLRELGYTDAELAQLRSMGAV
jgi:itaconate CoA-transferase